MATITASRRNGRPRGYAAWRPQRQSLELLADVRGVLDRYAAYRPLTIRQIFYALVGAERLAKTEAAYERLCERLNRARRARMTPFGAIRDDGVSVIQSEVYYGLQDFHDETARRAREYRRDRQDGQAVYVEQWTESAGMQPQLARVADEYSVPVYSCGGFASLSAVRSIADRAVARDVPTVLLHVGDYDPSGESIFQHIVEDAGAFVEADPTLARSAIRAVRVALTAEQVAAYDLPTRPPKKSDSRTKTWKGGTCQLEALPPDVLAELVEEAIRAELGEQTLAGVLAEEAAERAELLSLPGGES
jgi:hypothetical protein